jgi:hypothetical protein
MALTLLTTDQPVTVAPVLPVKPDPAPFYVWNGPFGIKRFM